MQDGAIWLAAIDMVARETTLFAAIWFLVGGADDLAVDFLYWFRPRSRAPFLGALPPRSDAWFAIFVPAWQEADVIGAMLRTALARLEGQYALYVGTYPNDAATIAAVTDIALHDPRVRLVIGPRPGPTTKADCLNALWRALLRDEAIEGTAHAVVLHDAEDVAHRGELRVFAHWLDTHDAVQLPVLPLHDPRSRFVAGHYADEFAEAHNRQLVVRAGLGAALPFAGVGCALSRAMIGRIAAARGGAPFDSESLTEDYELGLTVSAMGGRTAFVRVREHAGGPLVAVRAYFPAGFWASVRQKARWMTGIALAGWDRVGWSGGLYERWMRLRDRRMILAMPVLALGYCALFLSLFSAALHWFVGRNAASVEPWLRLVLFLDLSLLGWRVANRMLCVRDVYGWGQACWSVPRLLVANCIALFAAWRALGTYVRLLRGGAPVWDKTAHHFPEDPSNLPT